MDSNMDLTVSDEKRRKGLKYVSKSRVKLYKQCPRKFFYKYWCENRPPGNFYTERGSEVHETFEIWSRNLKRWLEDGRGRPDRFGELLPEWRLWSQWLDPFIGNFWKFEQRRYLESVSLNEWKPVGVEVEGWLGGAPDDENPDYVAERTPPVGDIPWMGSADVILNSCSVPGVDGSGVTILDYKTGSVPDALYRDEGIFLEGEYYGWLFEHFFDVDAVAGYYPAEDELLVSPYPSESRRSIILDAVRGMQRDPDPAVFEREPQPLCHWGDGKCYFYDDCDPDWPPETRGNDEQIIDTSDTDKDSGSRYA